jgi:ribosomal protein S18 acetylase RimI-like enzyme
MTLNISFVASEHRPAALRLLFARFPAEEQQTRLTDALRSAEQGGLNLDGLLLAEENGQPVGAALTMHQADGVSLVWPPVITCQTANGTAVIDALMTRLCEEIDRAGSKLAQVLLAPDDTDEITLLARHGFEQMADMYFIARTLTPGDLEGTPNDGEFDHEIFHETNRDRFAAVIERTYQQSLDCPFLEGFRNGQDALVSHRLSGRFDPAGWRLYRIGSQDIGVLLMNEHPDQNAIELVYFGIVPEFRGRGLGRRVLSEGVQAAALTGRAVMFLAVDCGNHYANALYSELGFAELAQRRVMVRRSARMARE